VFVGSLVDGAYVGTGDGKEVGCEVGYLEG